jgi:hypothetical protein
MLLGAASVAGSEEGHGLYFAPTTGDATWPRFPVVEASCTADSDELDRAVRRTAALAQAGFTAIGIVACETISPQTLDAARSRGLRVLTNGWLLPEAA